MTVKQLQEYINKGQSIEFNNAKYKAIGYQLLMKKGQKVKSAILQDINQSNSIIYVELEKIGGES